MSIVCLFTVFTTLENLFPKRSHRICSNFATTEASKGGTSSLKRFLKKTPSNEKYSTKASKKRNGVIMLPW